jgi:hypothetical protein
MARPLTKIRSSGELYTRLAAIETAIDAALALDRMTLERRAAITDPKFPEYMPSECLVHMIRKEHRGTNAAARDRLLSILLLRCAASLARALPDDRTPNAAYVRDEALGRLGELFAEDGTGDNPDELDYFEVRFNGAFAALRTDLVRAEIRATRRFVHLPEADEEEDRQVSPSETIARLRETALRKGFEQENTLFLQQIVSDTRVTTGSAGSRHPL